MKKLFWAVAVLGLSSLGACTSTATSTYLTCDSSSQCDLDELCRELDTTLTAAPGDATLGGVCTFECGNDLDCPDNRGFSASCLNVDGDPSGLGLCLQRCVEDFDCDAFAVCVDVEEPSSGFVDAVCLPNNG